MDGTLPEMLDRTLEDRIEEARTLVEKKTKMTEDVFKSWLERKTKKEMDAAKKAKAERWKKNRWVEFEFESIGQAGEARERERRLNGLTDFFFSLSLFAKKVYGEGDLVQVQGPNEG